MTTFSLNDDSVIVIIGSGAGGGTLANELCRRGLPVVLLEAGKRESPATFINDEWPSFEQLAWSDPRTTSGSWQVARDFPTCPRGSARPSAAPPPTGPAPACGSRPMSSAPADLRQPARRQPAGLAAEPGNA